MPNIPFHKLNLELQANLVVIFMYKTTRLISHYCLLLLLITIGTIVFDSPVHAETTTPKAEKLLSSTKCQLKMGWVSSPPYQYLDKEGQMTGLQNQLYKSIAKLANCQLTFIQGNWQDIQADIKAGNIDLMGDVTITPLRQSFGYFSAPYRNELIALYVLKSRLDRYPQVSLKELMKNGFRMAVTKDNFYGEAVQSLQNNPRLKSNFRRFDHNHGSYRAIAKGEVDGLFSDPMVHAYTMRLLGYENLLARHQVIVSNASVSLMFSKKTVSSKLVERFNRAIEEVKQTREYQQYWSW